MNTYEFQQILFCQNAKKTRGVLPNSLGGSFRLVQQLDILNRKLNLRDFTRGDFSLHDLCAIFRTVSGRQLIMTFKTNMTDASSLQEIYFAHDILLRGVDETGCRLHMAFRGVESGC